MSCSWARVFHLLRKRLAEVNMNNYLFQWWNLMTPLQANRVHFDGPMACRYQQPWPLPGRIKYVVFPLLVVIVFALRAVLALLAYTLWLRHAWAEPLRWATIKYDAGVRINIMVCACIWSVQAIFCLARDYFLSMHQLTFMAIYGVNKRGPIEPVHLRELFRSSL